MVKVAELRSKSQDELKQQIVALKTELASLRVAKVTGGAANKIAKIGVVRKDVARALTVLNQARKAEAVAAFASKKLKPLDQRAKKTRALRRALSKTQSKKITKKEQTRRQNFPLRKYTLSA